MAPHLTLTPTTDHPPPGYFVLDGRLRPRRFEYVRHGRVFCRNDHRITINGRMFGGVPQCEHHHPDARGRCQAYVYLFRHDASRYFLLDVNEAEAEVILNGHDGRGLDFDEVIVQFDVDFRKAS